MTQDIYVKGRVFDSCDPALQTALAAIHETPERPRCLCVDDGIDLYVSKRATGFYLARMPGTGHLHHPTCPDYEPSPSVSGRGALMGDAIVEKSAELLEVHVGFALSKGTGKAIPRGEPTPPKDVHTAKRRLSLLSVLHLLYEDARLNRWYPGMEGTRNQGVLAKYLGEAAEHILVRGEPLSRRLFVPEPFNSERKDEIAARRREKLAFLNSTKGGTEQPFGLIIGEFKEVQVSTGARKVLVKHMPDTPLYIDDKAWERAERVYRGLLEARDADVARKPRIIIAAVVYAKRETLYQIDRLSLMLVSDQYIPLNDTHELPLLDKLQAERRIFVKPLSYDSPSSAAYANFLLLDARTDGGDDFPLNIVSPFADSKEQAYKASAIEKLGVNAWIWRTDESIPMLPPARRYRTHSTSPAQSPDANPSS